MLDEKRREVAHKIIFVFGRDQERCAPAIENLRAVIKRVDEKWIRSHDRRADNGRRNAGGW